MNMVRNFRDRRLLHEIRPDGSLDVMGVSASPDERARVRAIGLGDVVKTVLGRSNVGVAIYVWGPELRLAIGRQHFNVLNVAARVTRRTIVPFLKRVRIVMDSEQPIKVSYFWIDLFEDPLNGTIDILKFVCEFMGARERCLRFFFVWQAIKNGDDATSPVVRESIEESVRKALG